MPLVLVIIIVGARHTCLASLLLATRTLPHRTSGVYDMIIKPQYDVLQVGVQGMLAGPMQAQQPPGTASAGGGEGEGGSPPGGVGCIASLKVMTSLAVHCYR
jgi:hypothetical protein